MIEDTGIYIPHIYARGSISSYRNCRIKDFVHSAEDMHIATSSRGFLFCW